MTSTHEFPHLVSASKIGSEPFKVTFTADARAREALARRYNILSVDMFSGEATLHREPDGMTIFAQGSFTANVTQACVTTLEPVADHIAETFEGWFLDESQATSFQRARKRRVETDPSELPFDEDEIPVSEEQEDPEPVVNGMVDIGELASQFLSLALNPYPHSEQAVQQGPVGDESDLKRPSPFDVLKDLKTS